MTVKAVFAGLLPHIRYPETHLHPSAQVALADLMLALEHPIRTVVLHLTNGRTPILALPKEFLPDEEDSDEAGEV